MAGRQSHRQNKHPRRHNVISGKRSPDYSSVTSTGGFVSIETETIMVIHGYAQWLTAAAVSTEASDEVWLADSIQQLRQLFNRQSWGTDREHDTQHTTT